jgi:hypothetical protein
MNGFFCRPETSTLHLLAKNRFAFATPEWWCAIEIQIEMISPTTITQPPETSNNLILPSSSREGHRQRLSLFRRFDLNFAR